MGRGLVSVRVGNADVESERTNLLIDQFESPVGVGAAGFAVADQAPDLVAVDAAAVTEPTAEPGEFVAFGGEHVEQDSGPSPFFPVPAGDDVQVPVFDVGVEGGRGDGGRISVVRARPCRSGAGVLPD